MKKTQTFCDICKNEKKILEKKIQVIFTTEQTEGRSCSPYLSMEKIDICQKCLDSVLRGNYLIGSGCQGYNNFNFKGGKKD